MLLTLAALANGAAMIAIPVVIALVVRRRTGARWALLAGGALAFVAAQVLHVPLVLGLTAGFQQGWLPRPPETWTLFDPLLLGFLAAAFEEPARAVLFARFFPRDRDTPSALMAGAGHGGVEAVLLGGMALLTLVNMSASRDLTSEQLIAMGVPADQVDVALGQIRDYWAMPWWQALLGAVERAITVPFHIALSVLVAAALRERRVAPFAIAFGAHWAADAVAVIAVRALPIWQVELVLAAMVVPFVAAVAIWARRRD